jgi:hypothetical protein
VLLKSLPSHLRKNPSARRDMMAAVEPLGARISPLGPHKSAARAGASLDRRRREMAEILDPLRSRRIFFYATRKGTALGTPARGDLWPKK